MNKAYSYIRFSTPEQLKGNSLQRQLEASDKYCKEHGLTLDTSLNMLDPGLSGRGAHIAKGALGVFLNLVQRGKIEKGSVLLVENLDRLSRQLPMEAFAQFTLIIQAGIKLVTLTDMQEYTKESIKKNPYQLMLSIGTMIRAWEESELKSTRLKKAWESKRKSGKLVTGKCPAWLQVLKDSNGNKLFKPREDVVLAIKRIFELKLQGIGEERIAIQLNKMAKTEGLWSPPKNKRNKEGGWRKSYISKILRSRAVIGEYTHHQLVQIEEGEKPKEDQRYKKRIRLLGTTRQKVSDPIPDYYPAIIDEKTFNRTQYMIQEKLKVKGFAGGHTGKSKNLFAHLVRCGLCGGPMHYIDKGQPPKGGQYLHCDNSRRNLGCDVKAVKYDEFQDIFFNDLKELDLSKFTRDQDGSEKEIDSIVANIEDYKQRLSDVNKKINSLIDIAETSRDPGIIKRLQERRKEELEIKKHIKDLEQQRRIIENSQNKLDKVDILKEVKQLLDTAKDEDERINLRMRIRAELQKLIDHIEIFPFGTLTIDPEAVASLMFGENDEEYLKEYPLPGSNAQKANSKVAVFHLIREFTEIIFYRYKSKHIQGVVVHFKGVNKTRQLVILGVSAAIEPSDRDDNNNKKPIILGS